MNYARDVVSGEGLILIKVAKGISARSSVVVGQYLRGVVWVWRSSQLNRYPRYAKSRDGLIVGIVAVGVPQRYQATDRSCVGKTRNKSLWLWQG